jgi:O-antigen/teichoic acid export membrane protein
MTAPAQLRLETREPALGRVRGTIAEFAMITSSEALLRIANFTLAVLIARQYSAVALGMYATAVAASTCAVTLADGGLQLSAIHRISADRLYTNSVYSQVLASKVLLLPVAALVAAAILAGGKNVGILWTVCGLVFTRTLLQSFGQINFSVLKALRQVPPIAALQYIHLGLIAAVLMAANELRFSLVIVLALLVACQGAEFAGSAYWLYRGHVRFGRVALPDCVALVRSSIPTGITATIATVVLRSDLLLLALFVTAEQVGRFAAAQFVMVAMYLGSWLFGSIVLPQLTAVRDDRSALVVLVRRWTRVFAVLLLPTTAVLIWIAPVAVRQLFGPSYQESGRLLAILLLATPFIWLNSLYLHRAIAVEDRTIHVRAYALVTAIAAMVSAMLAYRWGAPGIAASAVAREVGLFAVLSTMTARRP